MHYKVVAVETAFLSARADGIAGTVETRAIRCRWQHQGQNASCKKTTRVRDDDDDERDDCTVQYQYAKGG